MGSSAAAAVDPEEFPIAGSSQIPYDLFVTKKHKNGLSGRSCILFQDSGGNLLFQVQRPSDHHKTRSTAISRPNCSVKLLLDASGKALFSIQKPKDALWQCFRVEDDSKEELIFRVEKKVDKLDRTEFAIFLTGEKAGNMTDTTLNMRGSPFKRSCTIYNGDSIVAETSLMYQLGIREAFVPRSRFRVTIFPGHGDISLVVAMVAIFFHGRKLWI